MPGSGLSDDRMTGGGAAEDGGMPGGAIGDGQPAAGRASAAPEYAVPALDKALDVLELLADSDAGLTQAEIAAAIGRSVTQIFRVLTTLERRGYLYRDRQSGVYLLSTRLFDLAHRQEPLRSLIAAAHAPMRRLAVETRSSCNLSVLDAGRMRVIAQVVSPSDFGFQVRVGALFPVETTASGLVQLAFAQGTAADADPAGADPAGVDADPADADPAEAQSADSESGATGRPGHPQLAAIARRGYLEQPDALQPGVTDIVFPVLDGGRASMPRAIAVLTVPYVATSFTELSSETVRERAAVAAREIAESLLGSAS